MELKNKKFIIILSVAVLSAILIACGVYFFNNKQQAAVAEAEVAVEGNSTAVVEPEPEVVEEAVVAADDAEPAVVDDAEPEVVEEEEVAEDEVAEEEPATTVEQQLVADELPAEPAAPEGDGFIPDEEDAVLVDPSYIYGEDNAEVDEAESVEELVEDYEEPELADDSDFGPPVPMKDEAPPQLVADADAEVEKIESVDEVVVEDDAEAEA